MSPASTANPFFVQSYLDNLAPERSGPSHSGQHGSYVQGDGSSTPEEVEMHPYRQPDTYAPALANDMGDAHVLGSDESRGKKRSTLS